jgi:hypothetical protein
MVALYRSGRQADALEAYQAASRALADGHGLDPGLELKRLQAAILGQDQALDPIPAAVASSEAQPAASPRRSGRLPAPLTSFIGRHGQVVQIRKLVQDCRLLTLTGLPGVGKTGLAIELGRTLAGEFPDGILLAELASLSDGAAARSHDQRGRHRDSGQQVSHPDAGVQPLVVRLDARSARSGLERRLTSLISHALIPQG